MNLRRTLMLFALASCAWLGTAQAGVSGFHIGLTPYVGYADWDEQEGPVAENAVVASPDPVRGEIVKAFIVLKPEVSPSSALQEEIANFVKTRLAAHEYPREIEFVKELPMTTTGKIMRRELRKMEIEKKARKN